MAITRIKVLDANSNINVASINVTYFTANNLAITTGNLSFGTAGVPLGKTVALNMFLGF